MRVDRDFSELFAHTAIQACTHPADTNPRATTLVSARVTSEEGEMSGACIELSTGGARLRVPHLLPLGAEVLLAIDLPSERISVKGVVRSSLLDADGLETIGVQLVDPSPQTRGVLAAHAADQERQRSRASRAAC
jgi:hypothetical protein